METKYNTRSPAVKRLMREAQELAEPTYDYFAQPLSDNLFEWHFTVRGPAETEFDGGIYHGRIVLPPDYPMKPPNIIVLTPNGRFEVGKKICLSISGYHPETWQPSWSIRTALLAIIGFMPTPSKGTIGSLDYPAEERKKLAKKSLSYACPDCGIVAEFLKSQNTTEDSITSTAEEAKEIIKTMSMKEEGTDDKKVDTENKVKEETEEERYKRARKLYSDRMQIIIKKRLNQDIWLTQQNSASTDTSNSTSSSATTTMSNASTRASSTSPGGGLDQRQSEQQPVQSQQSRASPVQRIDQFETRNYVYDIVILIIAVVIGLLLYRRFTISMDVPPDTAPEPGDQ